MTRYCFSIGLQAQLRLTHLNINEASFFVRLLWLDADTRPYYINYSSYTVNAFRVQVENGLENVSFCIFPWFQSSLTYHDSCGPHWRLRSYSSQASGGYKLKRLELHSTAPCATLTPLSCSPNFPHAQYLGIHTLTHELIVNLLRAAVLQFLAYL